QQFLPVQEPMVPTYGTPAMFATHPRLPHSAPLPPDSMVPVAMSMPPVAPLRPTDPRVEVPATVITTRTRVLAGRPAISWAAALVAMGVFAGLVTAVLARTDGDAVVDATASFVDPSHHSKPAPAAQPPPAAAADTATSPALAAQEQPSSQQPAATTEP